MRNDRTLLENVHPRPKAKGFSLVEGLIAMGLLGASGMLLFSVFSFSVASQTEARAEREATRACAQIIELLRSVPYEELVEVDEETLETSALESLPELVLWDLRDRLSDEDMTLSLTIEPFLGRDEARLATLTIHSKGLSPAISIEELPPGKTLVRQVTVITQNGVSPG